MGEKAVQTHGTMQAYKEAHGDRALQNSNTKKPSRGYIGMIMKSTT